MQEYISAFEIIYKIQVYKLPYDVYDKWSLADLDSYIAYIDAKLERAKSKGAKGKGKTYTGDDIESLFRGGTL